MKLYQVGQKTAVRERTLEGSCKPNSFKSSHRVGNHFGSNWPEQRDIVEYPEDLVETSEDHTLAVGLKEAQIQTSEALK